MEAIKESISELSQMFAKKLAEFEERQQQIGTSAAATTLDADFIAFKTFTLASLRSLQSQVDIMACEYDSLEMHNRRKILLLHGVPEDKKEDTKAVIVNTVCHKLKLSDFKLENISRCHRMGKFTSPDRPRPILFKVRDVSLRGNIWAVKSKLKDTGVTLSEFLTKRRHDTFMEARKRFSINKCWTREGNIFILTDDGVRHRVNCLAELDKISTGVAASSPVPTTAGSSAVVTPVAVKEVRPRRAAANKK